MPVATKSKFLRAITLWMALVIPVLRQVAP
jgi:hypothetical protein